MSEPIPDEIDLQRPPRKPATDPTLGEQVERQATGTPRHRLVAVGDSLTHGFQSGAIFNTALSCPAIVAYELGWLEHFRYPVYDGPGDGLPVNIEALLRHLEKHFGDKIDWWKLVAAANEARKFTGAVEDHWERGAGSQPPQTEGIYHNLGIYGWDLRDAMHWTADNLEIPPPKDNLVNQIPENSNERAARHVLASARDSSGRALTPLGGAAQLGAAGTVEDGSGDGIETLLVALGANNALGGVVRLRVRWSKDDYADPKKKRAYTVWRPSHFKSELQEVEKQVRRIRARHVIWTTVPHVTIAPLARGVKQKLPPDFRYFPHYTYVWVSDEKFDARRDRNITAEEARAVDSAIDSYNEAIVELVRRARQDGLDWYLFDLAAVLDGLAHRRFFEGEVRAPEGWRAYELPPELAALEPPPNTLFFRTGPKGRIAGGLFSLDGVHPTTIGYGIISHEIMRVMHRAGVVFYEPDGTTARAGEPRVDFGRLIELDSLISNTPRSVTASLSLLGWIDQTLDFVNRALGTKFGESVLGQSAGPGS